MSKGDHLDETLFGERRIDHYLDSAFDVAARLGQSRHVEPKPTGD
jgi:hypothetical protein